MIPTSSCVDSFLSVLHDAAFLVDSDGRIVHANDIALATISGVSKGASIEDLADALGWDKADEALQSCLHDERSVFHVLRNKTGKALYELTCAPISDADCGTGAVLISVVNVAGEALMDERFRMLDRVFHSISEGVLTLDLNGRITGMNRSASELLSVSEEAVNLTYWEKVVPLVEAGARNRCLKALQLRERVELNTEILLSDDTKLPCYLSLSPLINEEEACLGYAVILKDRTVQLEMERNMVQMEKLNSLGKLVAGFAHELNNPLTSVIGFSQLLLGQGGEENVHDEVGNIYKHALRCKKIIDNLLTFARKSIPEKKAVQLNDVVSNTMDLLAYQLERDGIKIVLRLTEDLPAVNADASQMQQVLVNLIENSRYELYHQTKDRIITVRTEKLGDRAVVRIQDNGPGIQQHAMDKIFDPFFTTKPVGEGTGLGLSLSFGILQEHGGTLRVVNRPSSGAEFEICLPVHASNQQDVPESVDHAMLRGNKN